MNGGPAPAPGDPGPAAITALDVLPGDDVAVVCGWIDAAPTDAVVLYVMRGNGQLAGELGMRRLAHHAAENGRSIAIVTRSRALAARARQAGIPVARRPDRIRWDAGGYHVIWLRGNGVRLPRAGRSAQAFAVVGVLGVLAWLAVTVAPAATVTLVPPQDEYARVLTVSVSTARTTADIPRLLLPGRTVTATRTITLVQPTTGTAVAPVDRATASLTLTNDGPEEVVLPAGALLVAGEGGPLFRLDRPARLPPGGTLGVTATALVPGPAGNVPAGSINRWRDAANSVVSVTNPAPASGGADGPVPAVAAADVAAITARAAALARSATLLAQGFDAGLADAVLRGTATASVDFEDPAGLVGRAMDMLVLPVTYTLSAVAIPAGVVDELARALLTPPAAPATFVPGSARAADTGLISGSDADGDALVEIDVRASFTRGITGADVKGAVKGRSKAAALANLAGRYGIAGAEVDLSPGWAPWLPRFGFRIDVRFRPPETPGGDPAEREPPERSGTARASPRP